MEIGKWRVGCRLERMLQIEGHLRKGQYKYYKCHTFDRQICVHLEVV